MIDSAAKQLEGLGSAVSSDNRKEIRRLAHSLKANATTVGSTRTASLLQQIESLAATGALADIASLAAKASEHYSQLVATLTPLKERWSRTPSRP
jgi:HPt (histidine-containing phosphotransfer) domain-containing protein